MLEGSGREIEALRLAAEGFWDDSTANDEKMELNVGTGVSIRLVTAVVDWARLEEPPTEEVSMMLDSMLRADEGIDGSGTDECKFKIDEMLKLGIVTDVRAKVVGSPVEDESPMVEDRTETNVGDSIAVDSIRLGDALENELCNVARLEMVSMDEPPTMEDKTGVPKMLENSISELLKIVVIAGNELSINDDTSLAKLSEGETKDMLCEVLRRPLVGMLNNVVLITKVAVTVSLEEAPSDVDKMFVSMLEGAFEDALGETTDELLERMLGRPEEIATMVDESKLEIFDDDVVEIIDMVGRLLSEIEEDPWTNEVDEGFSVVIPISS